jgi:hypothetical protein
MLNLQSISGILQILRLPTDDLGFGAGGPCICFAKGQAERLTLQDLIDCLLPAKVASKLSVPLRIYFQSHEDLMMSKVLEKPRSFSDHEGMKRALTAGITAVLGAMAEPVPVITFIDTAELLTKAAIDEAVRHLSGKLKAESLYGLYKANSTYPLGQPEETVMLEVYLRNLALYTRHFFERLDGVVYPILLVENTGQTKAINLANSADGIAGSGLMSYLPALDRQGKEMNFGNRNHKIELRSTNSQIRDRSEALETLTGPFSAFYRSVFGSLTLLEVMTLWKKAI